MPDESETVVRMRHRHAGRAGGLSKVEDQAMFLQRTQQDVIDLLPDGMKERAAIYVDDTLEQETAEAGAEDRLHAALPAMGPETVTPGPELG